jgi:ATP/maltotriose-dependent transcriptional regulator MalT
MNTGRWYGELGDALTAMERLEAAGALARRQDLLPLHGKCQDVTAEVLLDQGRIGAAVQAAEAAIATGEETHNPELVCEAGATLSLAELCRGCPEGLERAQIQLDRIYRHRKARHTLNALVLRGIVALRRGDTETAETAFEFARGEAESLGNLDARRYNAHDIEGLARCGLALCNRDDLAELDAASRAFSKARAVTVASGVIVRVVRLIDELEAAGSPGALADPRRAASDRSLPQVAAD